MTKKISKTPTMRDIAKMAGVTQATVSYVINNSEDVSETVKKGSWMQPMNWIIYPMQWRVI